MKRVLLTGAGGAIGAHLLAHIMQNTDWEVVALDSWREEHKGYYDRITRMTNDNPNWLPRLQVITHDLNAPFTDREIKQIGDIDYILNLASRSDVQNAIEDPAPFARNNTELMLNILDYACRIWDLYNPDHKLPKDKVFLHFSTDEVYGSTPRDSQGHKEWSTILPSNPYSASKAAQEAYAIAWWRSYDLPLIITNTMNNFGEMQAPSKYPAMIQTKIQNGEIIGVHAAKNGEVGTRYYLHSRNTSDAVLFILKNVPVHFHDSGEIDMPERLNIVGDKQISNLELPKIIGELMGIEPKYELRYFHDDNPGHDLHYGLDGSKLTSLGWKSPKTFEESMKKTIEWQQEHKEWM